MRAPFQTLIIPYKIEMSDVFYGVFLRKKQNIWQFVAGGGEDVFVVPEYTFGINVSNLDIKLSNEHKEFVWLRYKEALEKLEFDSNKIALWELNERLKRSYNWN